MKITEIITNPPRDEYLDPYLYQFDRSMVVAKIRNLELVKNDDSDSISYGLFNEQNLVGLLALEKHKDKWVVVLAQLAEAFKGQGYGTFLYDYAIMNDGLFLISDATQTSGINGSKNLWLRLRDNQRYKVAGYDINADQIFDVNDPTEVYNNDPDIRWIAIPSGKTINESLQYIQSHMKNRHVVWYGPGTTKEHYFNY